MPTLELCFLLILFRASLHITGIVCLGKKVPDLHQAGSMLGNINFIGCENCKSMSLRKKIKQTNTSLPITVCS